MKGIATSYAMFLNIKYNRVGHVFQDRFKSEPVADERYLLNLTGRPGWHPHSPPVESRQVLGLLSSIALSP